MITFPSGGVDLAANRPEESTDDAIGAGANGSYVGGARFRRDARPDEASRRNWPTHTPTLGLIVNPVAGMGGSVGLKGTDGLAVLEEARRRGAVPQARNRARVALTRLAEPRVRLRVLTGAGELGYGVG